jgi:hypothetical protein
VCVCVCVCVRVCEGRVWCLFCMSVCLSDGLRVSLNEICLSVCLSVGGSQCLSLCVVRVWGCVRVCL